jgi:O-antigen/teichoic acid export membrane protein
MALLVLVQPLLLRFLGTGQYGVWALLTVVLSLALLADTGLTQAVTALLPRERRESGADGPVVVPVTLLFLVLQGLVVAAGIVVFAGPIIGMLLGHHDADATLALRIMGATVVPRLLQQWVAGYEAGLMKYHVFAVAESVALTLQNAGLVVLAMRRASLPTLAGWLLATTVAGLAIHWLALGRPVPRGFRFPERRRWREVLTFGYSFWVTGVALTVFTQVDRLVVNAVLGVEAVALYSVATGIGAKINELTALPLRPMLPFVSGSAEPAQVRRAFVGGTIACTVVVAIVTAGVVASARLLAGMITETHSHQLAVLIAAIATVYGLYSLSAPAFLTLLGLRRVKLLAFTVWAGCLTTLALIRVLASTGGLSAAAWGNAGFCIVLVMIFYAARASGASLPLILTINAVTAVFLLLFYAIIEAIIGRIGALSLPATIALLAGVVGSVALAGYATARRWVFAGPAES